ncbi:MAG: DUF5678 domain-containing protein [Candidatus Thermoplasmatota archaeon]|nr:DUF5678 domain-containing protein [Candidatus Thermoplasmatota archaeon]
MSDDAHKHRSSGIPNEPNEDEILMELSEREDTYEWISENWEELQDRFEKQYVAIKDRKVIDHGYGIDELREIFTSDPMIVIEFFPAKKAAMIL